MFVLSYAILINLCVPPPPPTKVHKYCTVFCTYCIKEWNTCSAAYPESHLLPGLKTLEWTTQVGVKWLWARAVLSECSMQPTIRVILINHSLTPLNINPDAIMPSDRVA